MRNTSNPPLVLEIKVFILIIVNKREDLLEKLEKMLILYNIMKIIYLTINYTQRFKFSKRNEIHVVEISTYQQGTFRGHVSKHN